MSTENVRRARVVASGIGAKIVKGVDASKLHRMRTSCKVLLNVSLEGPASRDVGLSGFASVALPAREGKSDKSPRIQGEKTFWEDHPALPWAAPAVRMWITCGTTP
jgi:hypothetical protein